ncbi:phosphodiesterase [Streptomyces sp. CRN 30]|uniref:phosphodiesterase n=1 Tax=Streptomyces sp. CRN 30 TaxID=3075613 RepID=UPI002A83D5A4|nr:phosphodiesterase [Streptomyces sp. CRN 30]
MTDIAAPPAEGRAAGGWRGPAPWTRWPLAAVETGFRTLARLRGAPALHPRGLLCTADFEVVDDGRGPWGVAWLDEPRRYTATVRLSRAAGLPRGLPDALGLAVRVDRDGHPLDLLLTSSGAGRITRHLPLPRFDALSSPCSSLLSYRIGGRRRVLAALPRRRAQAPVPADPARLGEALAAGPLVYDLCAARSGRPGPGGVSWRPFAALTVRAALPDGEGDSPGFDPYAHDAPGFTPGGTLAATRRAAYRGSRDGRRGK